ncbi:MCE family protein [Pseudomonas sp. MAP12]|uniref:MCE family protein n=1 Tax=Geopseudomonas aromaticivorans TaxID=2849492 RepID=A0ABS6MX23_9GAMM|nr:MlaD family protein [Pseudomonas aromaticivorans]MBV2133366.1 MCE family protein [Pseudomonas aromaticivorans]
MTELAQPDIRKTSNWSAIWVLPLLALIIGLWLLWRAFSEAGVEIRVHFADGEGIQVNKTQVMYKGIAVGKVIALHVSKDIQGVDATIEIKREAEDYLGQETRFWLVKPRVSLAGVTGLETLVSGIYIAVDPIKGERASDFQALAEPPPLSDKLPGLHLTLKAERLGSLDQGSPVFYRQIQVGQVKGYRLGDDERTVEIQIYIEQPYAHLIRKHTRFWNASGISFSGGLSGFKLRAESLVSIATGGIAFATPEHREDSPATDPAIPFRLYEDFDAAEAGFRVMLQLDNVSGLQPGRTPVIFNGVQVGTLKSLDMGGDFSKPMAELTMDPRTEELLLGSSEFWVVKPSISLAGITGLEALVQGNFLAVRFGKEGAPTREFSISAKAPPLNVDAPGLHLLLAAERLGSLDVGSPVLYRQVRVGSVQSFQLSGDRREVLFDVHIEQDYAGLVNASTRFWNASGISLKGGLSGVEVKSESLQTLVLGGIAFDTPDRTAASVPRFRRFTLFSEEKQARALGQLIELRARRGDGLREGTLLRYRGLDVGQVEQVGLSDDLADVLLKVRVSVAGERIARTGSRFWVVRPELGLARTANLDTLVSGPYLEVQPAPRQVEVQTRFELLPQAPQATPTAEGLALVLSAARRGSVEPGDDVTYREMAVGKVIRLELGPTADRVLIHILIEPRYAALVRGGSRFWNASGVDVDFGLLKGVAVRTESVEAILAGGIAFATPDEQRPAQPGQTFVLFDEPQAEWLNWAPKIPLGQ